MLIFSPFEKFYYVSLQPFSNAGGPLLAAGGFWYWVQAAQNYFLVLLGAFVILRTTFRYPGIYRGQSLVILVGILIPWLANAYYLLSRMIFPQYYIPLNFTALAFVVTGLIYSFGIFRLGFLDLAPLHVRSFLRTSPKWYWCWMPQTVWWMSTAWVRNGLGSDMKN